MYAVVTWRIDPTGNVGEIEGDAVDSLGDRATCEIHDDVRVTSLLGNLDYLQVVESLQNVADQHDPFFTFAVFQLRKNSPLRSNADYDEDCVEDVQD